MLIRPHLYGLAAPQRMKDFEVDRKLSFFPLTGTRAPAISARFVGHRIFNALFLFRGHCQKLVGVTGIHVSKVPFRITEIPVKSKWGFKEESN